MNLTEKRSTVRAMENILESRIEMFKSQRRAGLEPARKEASDALNKANQWLVTAIKKWYADERSIEEQVAALGVSFDKSGLKPQSGYQSGFSHDYDSATQRAAHDARIELERAKAAIWADDDANFSAFIDKLDKLFAVE
jgi:hypothetical protein